MIKLTQILNESEGNLSYLDNKVYRKYLNVLNKKYPELQNEIRQYIYPKIELGQQFNESKPYNKMFDFFGKGFFNLDVDDKCDLIFLFILNLDVKDFLTEELNVANGLYFVTMEMAQEGYDYYSETENHTCDECNGRGSEPVTCSDCDGKGKIEDSDGETESCDECDGSGEIEEECGYCGGDGEYEEEIHSVTKIIHTWFMVMTENPDFPQVEDGSDFIEKYADKVYVITAIKGDEEVAIDESNLPDDLEIMDYDVDEPNKFGIRYIML
jgi:hypothetical protein